MNDWEIIISPSAKKNINRIPEPDKGRILEALFNMKNGLIGDIKPLSARPEWRLRVGKWRILLNVNIQEHLIVAMFVETRGDVYKK